MRRTARAAASNGAFDLAALRRLSSTWQQEVLPVTLKELAEPAGTDFADAARRTHHALNQRVAQALQQFFILPHMAMTNPALHMVYQQYVSAFLMHEDFQGIKSDGAANQYWHSLAKSFDRNRNVPLLLGHARRQLCSMDNSLAKVLDGFLQKFMTHRIEAHLIAARFLNHAPSGALKPSGTALGVLQPTNPAQVAENLAFVMSSGSMNSMFDDDLLVPVEIDGAKDHSILFVPSLLRAILREVLKNAIKATSSRGVGGTAPVRVSVKPGRSGVFINVEDRGGGMDDKRHIFRWGKRHEEQPMEDWPSVMLDAKRGRVSAMPQGFGLPIARLYARHFGGDLQLQTLVGHGTNVYIHIPELQTASAE